MKYHENLVSILIPVCNAEAYLSDALESLLKQTHKAIEIIVIDDASRDNSFAILQGFKKKDRRLRVYRNKKRYGLAISYNRAMRRAKGAYIAFMNAKDVSSLHRIKRQVLFLLHNPKLAGVGTQFAEMDEKKKKADHSSLPTEHNDIYQSLISNPNLHYESVMLNRLLLPKDSIKFKSDVYPHLFTDVFLNLFKYGKFANINQPLYFLRKDVNPTAKKQKRSDYLVSYIQLLIKSITVHDYHPSIKALLSPLAKLT